MSDQKIQKDVGSRCPQMWGLEVGIDGQVLFQSAIDVPPRYRLPWLVETPASGEFWHRLVPLFLRTNWFSSGVRI
ncbi:MAG: hypothetical protein ACFE0I_05695 [Elainellaceae cyanobacterium]